MAELSEGDYDDMHHALGRPQSSTDGTYRNYYCCSIGSGEQQRFEDTGCWDFGRYINDGRDAIYHVNGVGKQKLGEWMDRRATHTSGLRGASTSKGTE